MSLLPKDDDPLDLMSLVLAAWGRAPEATPPATLAAPPLAPPAPPAAPPPAAPPAPPLSSVAQLVRHYNSLDPGPSVCMVWGDNQQSALPRGPRAQGPSAEFNKADPAPQLGFAQRLGEEAVVRSTTLNPTPLHSVLCTASTVQSAKMPTAVHQTLQWVPDRQPSGTVWRKVIASGAQQGALQWNWFQAPRLAIPHNLPPYYLHDFGEPPSWRFIIAFLCAERCKEMHARKTRAKVEVLSALSLAIYRQQDAPTAPTGLAGELCTLPIELIQIVAEKMMEKDRRDRADAGV